MIECNVTLDGDRVARIVMTEMTRLKTGMVGYRVDITIDKGASVGTHRRLVYGWPEQQFNPILLIKAALDLIDPAMAAVEGNVDGRGPSDLARQVGGAVLPIQGGESELCHHRPSLRGEQPEQHGRHSLRESARSEDRERRESGASYCDLQCRNECAAPENCAYV